MFIAFAEGHGFQGSIYWALSVINPERVKTNENVSSNNLENTFKEESIVNKQEIVDDSSTISQRVNNAKPKIPFAKRIEKI